MDRISLPINSRFEKIEQINSEFTRCKCYIMALGKNANGSHIGREATEDALETFKNVPVIAHLYEDEDGNLHAAGHEMKLVENDGKYEWRTVCRPYGVIPECNLSFEDVTEEDGTVSTYLVGEVILWSGKYPEIMDAAYSDAVYFNQSMEIKVLDSEEYSADTGYVDIKKFSASALCLLGKSDDEEYNVKPCFPSASVVPFSLDDEFTALMDEFKFALAESMKPSTEDADEYNEMSIDTNEESEDQEPEAVDKFEALFSTYNKKREIIWQAVKTLNVRDEDNDHYKDFWVADFDELYAYVEYQEYINEEHHYGHGRVAYSINDDEQTAYITGEFEEMFVKWLTTDELEALGRERDDFVAYKASHSTPNEEVDALREFKELRLAEDHRIEVENVLSQFEDLEGNTEFEELKKDAVSYSDLNELENQCYAIRGRTVRVNFSAKTKSAPIPIVNNIHQNQSADDVYGGLFSMYGYNKN